MPKIPSYTVCLSLLVCLLLCYPLASAESSDRALQGNEHYEVTKNYMDANNSYHYIAEYQGYNRQWYNSKIVQNIHIIVDFHPNDALNIKILDNDEKRWEIPQRFPFAHFKETKLLKMEDSKYIVAIEKSPFAFAVTHKDTGEVMFDTRGRTFVYSDVYIEISTSLPTNNVYGFGERNYKFKMTPGHYSLWNRDDARIMETATPGGNTYGHHPVGLIRGKSDNFFLTYMRNSNAMDIIIQDEPALTYKMVGGVVDLVFFNGDKNPDTVLRTYHNYIGNFTMMPFWSMGFHQSKWGYHNVDMMRDVVTQYNHYEVPLDVIWSDIDYMIEKEIFTVNSYNYPPDKMRELTTVHKKKWVPIIDPGVKARNARGRGLDEGLKRDIFIKTSRGANLMGSVWPGDVYFPDFFNPNTEKYWSDMLQVLYDIVPFAGIWLDMNEIANFVDGDTSHHYAGKYEQLPYNVGQYPLKRKTISLDAVHHGNIVEFDVHTQYGLLENEATYKFLQTKSKLPFILTRSTTVGIGQFSTHWTGDNGASWDYLQVSIAGNFNFQIFGAPFVGADICGFMGGTNEELCARWTQLGALYPFARNHHELETRSQEPWTFYGTNDGVTVLETARIAIKARYSLLKWYYSLFIEARGIGSVFRPLLFEFPSENVLYIDGYTDSEFLLGRSLLCTPKIEHGGLSRNAYFPVATWFDLFTGEKVISQSSNEDHRIKTIETPFDAAAPQFLRAGFIIHQQNVEKVLSTEDLNDQFQLVIAFDEPTENNKIQARGSIMGIKSFDDDSVYNKCMQGNCLYDLVATIDAQNASSAKVTIEVKKQNGNSASLDDFGVYAFRLYGLGIEPSEENQRKIGNAKITVTNGSGSSGVDSFSHRSAEIADGSFVIELDKVLRLQDQSSVVIELTM